jgi:5-formyltetrahydrofolate cyclo-ligase
MDQEKRRIRAAMLEKRRALAPGAVARLSAAILQRLRALPVYRASECVLTYVASMDNEVDTRPLIPLAVAEEKRVLVPRVAPRRTMTWHAVESVEGLQRSRFGVLEPPESVPAETPPPGALAIVPGLAFDRRAVRIGYGGGYYDRFLAAHPGPKIAIAYDFQLVGRPLPQTDHDIPVDAVVTETSAITP